jgi:phage terminase large subunit-like protein
MLGAMYEHAKRVEKDQSVDPRFMVDIYEAPPGLDFRKPSDREIAVKAASLGAGIMWNVADRVAEWDDPTVEHHEWIRYYANTWPDILEESWLSEHPMAWASCQAVDPDDTYVPDHAEIKVAVDMALRRDSVAVLYGHQRSDGRILVRSKIWRPSDGKVDHLEVINYIKLELASKFTITEITYDPRFFEVPARMLEDEGFNLVEFGQSVDRMTPACGEARGAILSGVVIHENDPDFNSHVLSAVARPNERGFTLSKGKSKRHIDAAVALVILLWRFLAPDQEEEVEVWAFYD